MIVECGVANGETYFHRNVFMEQDKISEFRREHKNTGVYRSAYSYTSEDPYKSDLWGDFYLDFDADLGSADAEEVFNKIRTEVLKAMDYIKKVLMIPESRLQIFFSGGKGIHLIIPAEVMGVEIHKNLNLIYKSLAEGIVSLTKATTIDLKIYDRRRLFRLPNSIHNKTGLYKVLLSPEELRTLSLASIRDIAKAPRPILDIDKSKIIKSSSVYESAIRKWENTEGEKFTRVGELKPLRETPPCIQDILDGGVHKGFRDNTATALCSFFRQQGLTEDESSARLSQWNDVRCNPPLKGAEIHRIVHSIYTREYGFGCNTMKILSRCIPETCAIASRI